MSLFREGNLLFIASYDISLPEGPSVNEKEFAWALHKKFGSRVSMFFMEPAQPLEEISNYQVTFLKRGAESNPFTLFAHQIDLYKKGSRSRLET